MDDPGRNLPVAYWVLLCLAALTALLAAAAFVGNRRGYGETLALTALALVAAGMLLSWTTRTVRERRHRTPKV